MLGKLTYFCIILVPGLFFNIIVWGGWWQNLLPRLKAIAATIAVISIYWGILDFIAIRLLGIWGFRDDHTSGLMALSLPLEEWTLFLVSGGFIVPIIYIFMCKRKIRS